MFKALFFFTVLISILSPKGNNFTKNKLYVPWYFLKSYLLKLCRTTLFYFIFNLYIVVKYKIDRLQFEKFGFTLSRWQNMPILREHSDWSTGVQEIRPLYFGGKLLMHDWFTCTPSIINCVGCIVISPAADPGLLHWAGTGVLMRGRGQLPPPPWVRQCPLSKRCPPPPIKLRRGLFYTSVNKMFAEITWFNMKFSNSGKAKRNAYLEAYMSELEPPLKKSMLKIDR